MISVQFVPIASWPGKQTTSRKDSLFSAKYSDTLDLLEKELRHINAREILIQTYLERGQIRNDGWPKSNATRPINPGVILTFVRNGKTISMPCDRYRDWECNLRAIALSLKALRDVDRYGVTTGGEQYRGWEALPPPQPKVVDELHEAAKVISRYSDISVEQIINRQRTQEAIRAAIIRAHPDKEGGSTEAFQAVNEARKRLEFMGAP